jgi:hypothetical protein
LGQAFPIPQVGHQLNEAGWDLDGTIVIIVSHSGGTFAPLASSNLMQSRTNSIFLVTSEWDTQIGKQLRKMPAGKGVMFESRIFFTNVGVRPAEPCTISVAATHQLLTLMLEYMCQTVLAAPDLRAIAGCAYSDRDLSELERCNVSNIAALSEIVGVNEKGEVPAPAPLGARTSLKGTGSGSCRGSDSGGRKYDLEEVVPSAGGFIGGRGRTDTERALRRSGEVWAQHVLEGPRAWAICAVYIVITVTMGIPLVSGIGSAAGVSAVWALRLMGFFDSIIYLFIPQLACLLIRAVQGRPLLHRMVARTVVIGDCPWVAQSMEAYVSKLFACAYSAASISVISGNPADHLVHRHTHRVMRGTLIAVGRPDGRLSALTSLESTVSLSVNQASSIQNLGVTCESITIGHNPHKLPLTAGAVFLKSFRPRYLCEQLLSEAGKLKKSMSSGALMGEFSNLRSQHSGDPITQMNNLELFDAVNDALNPDNNPIEKYRKAFDAIDSDGSGDIDFSEFSEAYQSLGGILKKRDLLKIFEDGDLNCNGQLDFEEFLGIMQLDKLSALIKLGQTTIKGLNGMVCVSPSDENYFGENLRAAASDAFNIRKSTSTRCLSTSSLNSAHNSETDAFILVASQNISMHLYEARIASLQRFVSMSVMFHEMGKRVQDFWPAVSCGYLGYDMSRTHSIMRIATTASPVSGAEVRDRMVHMTVMGDLSRFIRLMKSSIRDFKYHKDIKQKYMSMAGLETSSPTETRKNAPASAATKPQMCIQTDGCADESKDKAHQGKALKFRGIIKSGDEELTHMIDDAHTLTLAERRDLFQQANIPDPTSYTYNMYAEP